MGYSRRAVIGTGVGLLGLGLRPRSTSAQIRFEHTPFTLGVASGYPEPNAVVLWTRAHSVHVEATGLEPARR